MSLQKIVFSSSLPRSGSTLLQNILAQNPRFYCTPTNGLFELLYASREQFTKLPFFLAQDPAKMRLSFQGYCRGALHGFFEGSTDRPVCVDKSRGWYGYYDWLCEFHPQPKILVCVRDLRSILSSMEKRWRKYPHLQRPDEDPSGLKMRLAESRVAHWLNSVPVGNAITCLMGAVEAGHHRAFHIVRFEDLTTNPQQTLRGIYDYLEEEPFAHDFDNVAQTTQEDDSHYGIYGDHRIRQKVAPVPPDYHETFGKALSNTIKADNAAFYATFFPEK
ncbi:MAG TPA: sulfotransferase [Chthoniobacteraceae bacterium]|jgi:sulfotransferase